MLMPVAPSRIMVRYRGRNQVTALLDGGEVTDIRAGEHAEVSLSLCLPRKPYPFARYQRGFIGPEAFLERLHALRGARRPFRFICSRVGPRGRLISDVNLRVTLEDLTVTECAEGGDDVTVALTLREYQTYSATRVVVDGRRVVIEEPAREIDNRPRYQTHVVERGDNLWDIARRFLGDGRRYREIFELNRDQIVDPGVILVGMVLRVPVG